MKGLKWFERKWFVNRKIRTRLNISFLLIAVIAAAIGAAGILVALSADLPNSRTYAIVFGSVSVLEILFALLLGYINAFLVVDPMGKNGRVLDIYSVGNFDTSKIIRERDYITADFKDEIGEFSRKLKKMMRYMKSLNECILKVSGGDLCVDVPICSPEDQIGNGLSALVNNFNGLIKSIISTIDQVTSNADRVSDSSMALSQGAMHQASAVQELTASLEQISSQTHLNAQNAQRANELTKSAKENAAIGNAQMKDMLNAMDDISVSSNNINKIIKVIDDIAFQTNILALNAAVEAARAGQHGKGFAVVAEEVKNLAGKSATAAKETTDMIVNSIIKVEAGIKIADGTARALEEIVTQVDKAADLISSISSSSQEQALGIEQINSGIGEVSKVIQANADAAHESATISKELSGQAMQLKDRVSVFRL